MSTESEQPTISPSVIVDRTNSVLTVTLNRPSCMNAITGEMCTRLRYLGDEIAADKSMRVVILKGAGRCFSVGGDATLFSEHSDNMRPLIRQMVPDINEFILALKRMDKMVIASVHGVAAGGGLSLALACDLVAAAENTQFAWGYRNLGTSPDAGGTYFLTRSVGAKKALELLLHRHVFSAADAEHMGLINWVVPEERLDSFVTEASLALARLSRNAVAHTKRLVNLANTSTLEQQLAAESDSFANCASRPDFKEGLRAFLGKRTPDFRD